MTLDTLDEAEEGFETGSLPPSATGLFDNLVAASGGSPDFEYYVGLFSTPESASSVQIMGLVKLTNKWW